MAKDSERYSERYLNQWHFQSMQFKFDQKSAVGGDDLHLRLKGTQSVCQLTTHLEPFSIKMRNVVLHSNVI